MNNRLVMKKAIGTFAKIGDLMLDDVEVGMPGSILPHGNVDLTVVSCLERIPPVCFFNDGQYTCRNSNNRHLTAHTM